MNLERRSTPTPSDDLRKVRLMRPEDIPPEVRALQAQDRAREAYERLAAQPKAPPAERRPRSVGEIADEKIARYNDINHAYAEDNAKADIDIKRLTERLNPLHRTYYGQDQQQSTESVVQQIAALQEKVQRNQEQVTVNGMKQVWLRFHRVGDLPTLKRDLEAANTQAAQEVAKAYQEAIQANNSHESLAKLHSRRLNLRAIDELLVEIKQTNV